MSSKTADFTTPATHTELEALATRLRERNFEVLIVAGGAEAAVAVMERIPDGALVHAGKSKTLEDIGVFQQLMESDRFDFVRRRTQAMDRRTQRDEMRRLGAAPDIMLGSVQAVTEAGQLIAVSASGSQIGPYGSGAGKLILVVGAQKVVPDLDTAFARIGEHVFPYEDARLREQLGVGTKWTRTLIIESDYGPGRTTVILVEELLGV